MSDLISRQAAIEAMSRISDSICEAEAVDALCEVPTIELIRCKDCKYLRLTGAVWKCQNRLVMMLCEPNDYCSRAERRGEHGKTD